MMPGQQFDPVKTDELIDATRRKLIDSDWIADKLNINKNANVLDFGAGNGYFTLPLAEKTKGTVYAVDVDADMLSHLGIRARENSFDNIEIHQVDLEDTSLKDNLADSAVAGFVFHEVPDRIKAFKEMKRLMKDGAKGAVAEWARVEGNQGPPLNDRLAPETVTADMEKAGLKVEETHDKGDVYVIFFSA